MNSISECDGDANEMKILTYLYLCWMFTRVFADAVMMNYIDSMINFIIIIIIDSLVALQKKELVTPSCVR